MVRPLILALCGLLACPAAVAQTSPPPTAGRTITAPVGYNWQLLSEVNAAVLKPYTWNYKAETSRDAQAYFVTREKIMPGKQFQTGLSLNVVRRISVRSKQPADAYARSFTASSGRGAGQQVLSQETKAQGPLRLYGVRYRVANAGADAKIIQQWAIANATTDTFYLLIFESPEKEWPQAWKLGEEMIKQLRLDAKV